MLIVTPRVVRIPWGKPWQVLSVFCSARAPQTPGLQHHVGKDLIVVSVHGEHGNIYLLQIVGQVGLREGDDQSVVGHGVARHALPPPVL